MSVDVYQIVTDRIISQLEKGEIPWHKPWTGVADGAFNRVSKKPYSLLNQFLLDKSGEWASYKQWEKLGGHVRKGEKGSIVVFWKINKYKESVEIDGKTEERVRVIPLLKYYTVFHIDQVDGVNPLDKHEPIIHEPIEEAEDVISDYISRSGIDFSEEESNRAYYSPAFHRVVVPKKEQFPILEEYYSTAFHELTHSTGHNTLLDRFSEQKNAKFGSDDYSKEELVAEIGSATIMNMLGMEIPKTFENSVAYIQNWLSVLKNDKKFIVSASSMAGKAINLIMGIEEKNKESEVA